MQTRGLTPVFGRHEGFYPKINHFKKLLDCVKNNPRFFSEENAFLTSGITKSRVKPLKYWGSAFKLIEEKDKKVLLTDFGEKILSSDPYLESETTVILLNEMLFEEPCIIPSWYFFFNEFPQTEFTQDDLTHAIRVWTEDVFKDAVIPENAIKKDTECIIKMYSENIPENPFYALGIITGTDDCYKRGNVCV